MILRQKTETVHISDIKALRSSAKTEIIQDIEPDYDPHLLNKVEG